MNITDQAYVDALNFMVETAAADYTPADALATAATESQELFTNGKVAMQLNWSHQYPAAVEAMGADMIKPVLLTALSVRIIDAARTFDIIWAMTEGGPNSSSETISIVIYKTLTRYADIGYASSMAVIFIVVLVVFTLVFMQSLWNPRKSM